MAENLMGTIFGKFAQIGHWWVVNWILRAGARLA